MIGEIAAIISGLKAVNEGIDVLKTSGANLGSITAMFDRVADLQTQIDQVEQSEKTVLTQDEALQLAMAKNEVRQKEKELKKALLKMPDGRKIYNDMIGFQARSFNEAKAAKQRERDQIWKARLRRQDLLERIIQAVIVITLVSIAGSLIYITQNDLTLSEYLTLFQDA